MKVVLLVVLFVAFASGKVIHPLLRDYQEGDRFAYVPDNQGNLYLADLTAIAEAAPKFDAFTDIKLFIYTRNNPNDPDLIENGNLEEFPNTHFDASKPVKFVIHGWINDWDSEINGLITSAFLEALDVNVIVVDWSYGGSTILYPIASARVSRVGEFVASVVDWLVGYGVPLSNFHVIGHSLGAHAAGYTGRNVKSGTLPYITGMDPALPLWGTVIFYSGISKDDGDYVEIIHTDSGLLGILFSVGHVDFYPNGGGFQPGCFGLSPCSHARAYKFFADSLDHEGFKATKCSTVTQATLGLCWGENVHMGGAQPKDSTGVFHLKTNRRLPYYQG